MLEAFERQNDFAHEHTPAQILVYAARNEFSKFVTERWER